MHPCPGIRGPVPFASLPPNLASLPLHHAGGVKKARKKKDKNAPKRGMSAFMFFSQDQRESVKADNPGIAFGEVGKVLGQRWKELSEADKKPYEEKAAKDKVQRYGVGSVARAAGPPCGAHLASWVPLWGW